MYHLKRISFILLGVLLLSACNNNKSAQLCKTWRIEDLKYTTEVPEQMKPRVEDWVNEMKTAFSITYNADGTYYTVLKDQKLEGKWKLNWNSSSLTATAHDSTVKQFHVKELSDSKFTFEAEEAGEKVIFTMIPDKNKP